VVPKKRKRKLDENEKEPKLDSRSEDPMLESPKSFGYKLPDYFMEYGPVKAEDLEAAKAQIRQRLGVRRLPPGLQVWDLAERPLARWRVGLAS
jgi:hypothetical protein